MQTEIITLNKERNVTLTAYTQPVGGKFANIEKRPAILILPGGGYEYCSDREADPVAFCYLQAGYQAFILRYSVAEHAAWPNPLEDLEQAMEMIRAREDWNVYKDKVAVAGFSAGGHLAAAAATMSKNRPNAAILGYAVTGHDVKACNMTAPDTTLYVDKDTCPCFVFATRTDDLVPIQNSISFMDALNKADISFESHIYAYGPHGFTIGNSSALTPGKPICNRAHHWVEDSIEWLKDMFGDFGYKTMTEPKCRGHFSGDSDAYLNLECTIGHLMKFPEAVEALGDFAKDLDNEEKLEAVSSVQLKGALRFTRVPQNIVDEIEGKLKQIPNIRKQDDSKTRS